MRSFWAWMRSSWVWMRSIGELWMRSFWAWMRSIRVWMRSSRVYSYINIAECGRNLAECGWDLAECKLDSPSVDGIYKASCGWDLSERGWDLAEWLERLTVNAKKLQQSWVQTQHLPTPWPWNLSGGSWSSVESITDIQWWGLRMNLACVDSVDSFSPSIKRSIINYVL